MDKQTKNKVEYIIAVINDFPSTHSLISIQTYCYKIAACAPNRYII